MGSGSVAMALPCEDDRIDVQHHQEQAEGCDHSLECRKHAFDEGHELGHRAHQPSHTGDSQEVEKPEEAEISHYVYNERGRSREAPSEIRC